MENHTIVTLKKGEGRTIKAGGAWIFDNEIDTITGTFTNGDIVVVHDFDGYPMGRGFINQNSKIRIRMMTRKADQLIDDNFLRMRVQNAWDYRKQVIQDIMPTFAAVSKIQTSAVQTTFWMFAVLFTVLLVAEIGIMLKQIKKGPVQK